MDLERVDLVRGWGYKGTDYRGVEEPGKPPVEGCDRGTDGDQDRLSFTRLSSRTDVEGVRPGSGSNVPCGPV